MMRENSSERVHTDAETNSRYMKNNKKKFNLGGISYNVSKLKADQVSEMTKYLISMKAEYDQLLRESIITKDNTINITKQIKLLEDVDKKTNDNFLDSRNRLESLKSQTAIKKTKHEEESYTKTTLTKLIERMREEILVAKKNITEFSMKTEKYKKEIETQSFKKTDINEKSNKIHLSMMNLHDRNSHSYRENEYLMKYYGTVIEQKKTFMKLVDDRKEKQLEVALQAKNDSMDKLEVKKRKEYFAHQFFNKYLRVLMEKLLKENEQLEATYLEVYRVSGTADLRVLIEKLMNKDKNYNKYVVKIDKLMERIQGLKKENRELIEKKIEAKYEMIPNITIRDEDNKVVRRDPKPDKAELDALKEEMKLLEELKEVQAKNEEITLTYDRVRENIRNLLEVVKVQKEKRAEQDRQVLEENGEQLKEKDNREINETNMETRNETDIKQTTEDKEAGETEKKEEGNEELQKDDNEGSKGEEPAKQEETKEEQSIDQTKEKDPETEFVESYFSAMTYIKQRLNEVFLSLEKSEYEERARQIAIDKQNEENKQPRVMRKVLTSKVKAYNYNEPASLSRAKTSKEVGFYLNPDYDYNIDNETFLEEKEIQKQIRIMINDAKRDKLNRSRSRKEF